MRRLFAALLLLAVASTAWAWDAGSPTQHGTLSNSETVSTASNAATVTLTGVAFRSWHIYSITPRCNSTWASVSITNDGTTIFSTDTSFVSVNSKVQSWTPPLTGSIGKTMVVTVGPCAPGSIATVDVQADNY